MAPVEGEQGEKAQGRRHPSRSSSKEEAGPPDRPSPAHGRAGLPANTRWGTRGHGASPTAVRGPRNARTRVAERGASGGLSPQPSISTPHVAGPRPAGQALPGAVATASRPRLFRALGRQQSENSPHIDGHGRAPDNTADSAWWGARPQITAGALPWTPRRPRPALGPRGRPA